MGAMIARIDVLNSKVEDILRFARPRSPVVESVDLTSVLQDAVASARAAAGAGCPEIAIPQCSVLVQADREMLRDVLLNVLLNACQAAPSEAIDVQAAKVDGMYTIEIADRGAGFGDKDPEQLFEAFHTTKKSGTGLGLAIVRRLISIQGRTISLHAREGGGTIARFTLAPAREN